MSFYDVVKWARQTPDKTALIHNDRQITYRGLTRLLEATRRRLEAEAPEPGVVAVLSQSLFSSWVMISAARALGFTTVAVSHFSRLEELRLNGLTAVVMASDEPRFQADTTTLPPLRRVLIPSQVVHAAEGLPPDADAPDRGPLGDHILYTSGTTGAYKKVVLRGEQEEERLRRRSVVSGLGPDTVYHAFDFGLWTGAGFKTGSNVWLAGGTLILDQTEGRFANVHRHRPNFAQAIPETLRGLLTAAGPDATASETLRLGCGGSLIPLDLAEQVQARIAQRLGVIYSATELNSPVLVSDFEGPDDLIWLTPSGLAEAVEVVDEDGAVVPPGVEGRIRFRLGPLDTQDYLDDPDATAKAFRDGCFYTGDLAVTRTDGRVRILGRVDDVLNVKGQKLAVGPIEENLQRGLGVEELCVFLGLAPDGVEELVVAIRSQTPVDRDDVLRRLGPTKIFDRVRVEVFAAFPRTNVGLSKIKRTELRRWLFPPEPVP